MGVLFLALVLAGVFAGVGHAGEIVGAEEAVDSTSSSSDVIAEPVQPEAPAEESSGTSPGDGVPADQNTSTETPSDTTGGEAPSSQTPTETPPPEPTESPTPEPTEGATPEPTESPTPETPAETGSESPPLETTPDTPPENLPTETAPVKDAPHETPTTPGFSGDTGEALIILGIGSASSDVLALLPVTESASTRSRGTGLAENDARSMKAVDPLPGRSPASSSSSGASTGSASSGSGGGLVLPAEFLLALLVMPRYTFRLSFALPHSRAFALRQERPG